LVEKFNEALFFDSSIAMVVCSLLEHFFEFV